MKLLKIVIILAAAGALGLVVYYLAWYGLRPDRLLHFRQFMRDPEAHADWTIRAKDRCGDAPFQFPTDGYIGFLWGDSFRPGHTHQGIDIFGGRESGATPVYAAHDGYLTRLEDWKSSLIIRIPSDPLEPDRQIWTYYTHLADEEGNSYIDEAFPPRTTEQFVEAGTLLGYQGNYSGSPDNPTGIHLHFSIVKDDGDGNFKNELEFRNTMDPSPYFGLPLNGRQNRDTIPVCSLP